MYLGLHVGEVFYGNVGSRERLDFTVIGPAVNEASRIAAMCRSVDQPVLCRRRLPLSAALNAASFRWDDTRYAASHILRSYLRSIPMDKQWNSGFNASISEVGSKPVRLVSALDQVVA
jgi:hypothetical protein